MLGGEADGREDQEHGDEASAGDAGRPDAGQG